MYRRHSWWEQPPPTRTLEWQSDLELVKKKTQILEEAHANKVHMDSLVKYHLGEKPPQVTFLTNYVILITHKESSRKIGVRAIHKLKISGETAQSGKI